MYDLKYNGVDEDMNFIFRANVFNATGYDWNQVRIQLSTANPTIGFGIPSFDGSQSQTRPNQDGEVEFQTVEVFMPSWNTKSHMSTTLPPTQNRIW